jgi:hypothetical protein
MRFGSLVALVVLWMVVSAAPALADPPGPTDYLSEVTEIEPAVPGIDVEIIGGDSFVMLTVADGVAVDVVGYSGEPYLRFLADGTVEENRRSPSKYLNEDRYAETVMPDDADPSAVPEWVAVATDGSYAWHDHRTHWMNDVPPPGRGPGDQVAEGVVPLFVDGVEVDVTVISVWQAPPSSVPVVVGLTVGLLLASAAVMSRGKLATGIIAMLAAGATVVGSVAYLSMPPETVPPWSLWAFPATALVVVVVVLVGAERSNFVARQEKLLLLVAALELVGWGVAHWSWLWPALLPTSLPFWIDRLVASTTLVGAIGAAAAVLLAVAAPQRRWSLRS